MKTNKPMFIISEQEIIDLHESSTPSLKKKIEKMFPDYKFNKVKLKTWYEFAGSFIYTKEEDNYIMITKNIYTHVHPKNVETELKPIKEDQFSQIQQQLKLAAIRKNFHVLETIVDDLTYTPTPLHKWRVRNINNPEHECYLDNGEVILWKDGTWVASAKAKHVYYNNREIILS